MKMRMSISIICRCVAVAAFSLMTAVCVTSCGDSDNKDGVVATRKKKSSKAGTRKAPRKMTMEDFMKEYGTCQAEEQYLAAAEKGDAEAQYQLGKSYLHIPGKGEAGLAMLSKAVEQGHAEATLELGRCYNHTYRITVCSGFTKASVSIPNPALPERLQKMVDAGNGDAMGVLGYLYATGEAGLSEDRERAGSLFECGHDKYSTEPLYHTGCLFMDDDDTEGAQEAWRVAAKHGSVPSMLTMASMMRVMYIKPNREEMKALYEKAASSGSPEALSELAFICYKEGDEERALELFEKAAAWGTQYRYAYLLYMRAQKQDAGKEDRKKAFLALARTAANPNCQNDYNTAEAKYLVGKCYVEGFYVAKDVEFGKQFLKLASEKGCKNAEKLLLELK